MYLTQPKMPRVFTRGILLNVVRATRVNVLREYSVKVDNKFVAFRLSPIKSSTRKTPVLKSSEQKAAVQYLTPPEIAVILGVAHAKVLRWIESGELLAVDLSTSRNGRRRFKVARVEFERFLERRSTKPRSATQRRRPAPIDHEPRYY